MLKNPAALESYYQGEQLLWRSTTRLELREAQRLFEESIRLEPTASVGYAAAALTYWTEAISGLTDTTEFPSPHREVWCGRLVPFMGGLLRKR